MKQEHRENLNWAVGLTMGITHAISGENGNEYVNVEFLFRGDEGKERICKTMDY